MRNRKIYLPLPAKRLAHRAACCAALVVAALAATASAQAQDYRFTVNRLELEVFVQADASARLDYEIDFTNAPGAHPIDIVDIGLPHRNYSISNMTAAVDGQSATSIRKSQYVDIGVEAHLGAGTIQPGQAGAFTFTCTMPDMVYSDTTDSSQASLQIRPTWFDPKLQLGSSLLRIAVHLPPGVTPEQVKWHSDKTRYDNLVLFGEGDEKHVVAIWEYENHTLSSANPKVGISFPRSSVDRVVKISAFGLLIKWFEENKQAQLVSGLLLMAAFAFLFYRFAGFTGWILFLFVVVPCGIVFVFAPAWQFVAWPIMGMLIALNEWRRTRLHGKYLPAMATIEGGGIKRGLTAAQAAVLLETPLGRVLAMVIFGLIKKNVVDMVDADPLKVQVREAFRKPRRVRRKAAQELGVAVHSYEHAFIDLLLAGDKPVEKLDFSRAVGGLVKSTAERMKGFDLSDTQDYYRRIVARAWKEAGAVGEIKQRDQAVDKNFEWMLADPTWDNRWDVWAGRGYIYTPSWTRHSGGGLWSGAAPSADSPSSQTSFGEVASSFVGWTENTSGKLVGAIDPTSMGIEGPAQAVIDLSGVDRITGDVFEALSESSGSGGGGFGGGGGCACACAGCACACACAGGGR